MPMERFLKMSVQTQMLYIASAIVEGERRKAAQNQSGKAAQQQYGGRRPISEAEMLQYIEDH